MAQTVLADGLVRLCIDVTANQAPCECSIILEGQYIDDPGSSCTVNPDEVIRVQNERDIECLFGVGSILSESLKIVFCACGEDTDVFAIPRAAAVGSIAAEYKTTITGTALTSGRIELFLGEYQYNVDVFIPEGATPQEMATIIIAALPDGFPYDAVADVDGITWTAKNAGEIGNWLNPIYNWRSILGRAPGGVSFDTVRTVDGDGAPDPLDYNAVLGECCYCCYGLLSQDLELQNAMGAWIRSQWDCDTPQCFGHGYTFNSGTLGEILARGDNSAEWSRLAVCEDEVFFPWLAVANYAALSCCATRDDPGLSIQGSTYGVLDCIQYPQSCKSCWTFDEAEQLRENAFVTYGDKERGCGTLTSPYIYNDVTNWLYDDYGKANYTFRDANSRRLARDTAIQIAEELQQINGLALFTRNTDIPDGKLGTNPRMIQGRIKEFAKRNIGTLFSEFEDYNRDIQVKTDEEIEGECRGKPGRLHLFFAYRPPQRLRDIITTLKPKLLGDC